MGGNALKTVKTNRITASEYVDASTKLYELLISIGLDATVIPAYRDKESFGDIDVVIATHKMDAATLTHCMDVVAKAMGSKETSRNSNVLSLDWSGESWSTVQVDLIFHDSSYADFAIGYYSYNDLGNLIGRIAHKMGFTFGHDGLWLTMRDGDHKFAKLLMTDNFKEALEFLGYDKYYFDHEVNTLEDIFRFTTSSRFFNKDLYPLEHRNAVARIRDKKRNTYMKFLRWVDVQDGLTHYEFPENKLDNLPRAFAAFPGLSEKYNYEMRMLNMQKAAKLVFNGELVSEWTGLVGKELGGFMTKLRESMMFSVGAVSVLSVDEVKSKVMQYKSTEATQHAARNT